jgi:Gluconate 2-dehydrogenase subunit 3
MNRRELLKNIAIVSGGLFVGSNFLLTSCKNEAAGNISISSDLLTLLDEVAETIIPETDTPGAKTTEVAKFINLVYQDIYTDKEQKLFVGALTKINEKAKSSFGGEFVKLSADKKAEVINAVKNPKDKGFLMVYQMVLYSYLTSEKGLKASYRYLPIPGKLESDIPYKKGDKMFASLDMN